MANIRGGGEFGPRWHQAALRENRRASTRFKAYTFHLFWQFIFFSNYYFSFAINCGTAKETSIWRLHSRSWRSDRKKDNRFQEIRLGIIIFRFHFHIYTIYYLYMKFNPLVRFAQLFEVDQTAVCWWVIQPYIHTYINRCKYDYANYQFRTHRLNYKKYKFALFYTCHRQYVYSQTWPVRCSPLPGPVIGHEKLQQVARWGKGKYFYLSFFLSLFPITYTSHL